MRNAIVIAFLLTCASALVGQNQPVFQVYVQANYNWTNTSYGANHFWVDYNHHEPEYWPLYQYDPLLNNLNWQEATWQLQPTPQIGFAISTNNTAGFFASAHLVLTGNNATCTVTSAEKGAVATLEFIGKEMRVMLQPAMGYRANNFFFDGRLILGFGFAKQYSSTLHIVDENNIEYNFQSDYDNFYNSDFSVGAGIGIGYFITPQVAIQAKLETYRVNTSRFQSSQWLDFSRFNNGYWNNTVALAVCYQFKRKV
jgi:opacity protein-like surface antigen